LQLLIPLQDLNEKTYKLFQWMKEIRKYGRKIPYILIGTKLDLRVDEVNNLRLKRLKNQKPVSMEEGTAMAKRIGAVSYFETSALIKVRLTLKFKSFSSA
jgi:GTPase SAR1 family protein